MTGVSSNIGIDSEYMLRVFRHGQTVIKAAKRDKASAVGKCKAIAYLFRRPIGEKYGGGAPRSGAWFFIALNADEFCKWDPKSKKAPQLLIQTGGLLAKGASEGERVQLSAPSVPLVARSVPKRDRWQELQQDYARRGWVVVLDFVKHFDKCKNALPKNAAESAMKRLSTHGCELQDDDQRVGKGRRPKMAKVCDLKRCYPELK